MKYIDPKRQPKPRTHATHAPAYRHGALCEAKPSGTDTFVRSIEIHVQQELRKLLQEIRLRCL